MRSAGINNQIIDILEKGILHNYGLIILVAGDGAKKYLMN